MEIISRFDLVSGFKELGLNNGDTVLVHSSLKSFGKVEGGAECVIESILETIGENGTLIVPALTGKSEDSPEQPPIFDVNNTPCWTGKIPETVRRMPGVIRSLHPTHSAAAIGFHAKYITTGHENSCSPCDKESPYWKNALKGGYIMLIGVDQESNTTIHSCEEIAQVPYHLQKDVTATYIKGYDDRRVLVVNRLHDWNKPETDFNHLDKLYKEKGIMRLGRIGNAEIRLIDAAKMFEFTVQLLIEDPLFLLVDRDGQCLCD